MIYHKDPTDWRDLQDKVKQIFEEMEFATEKTKTVKTARGKYELDVHAIDSKNFPESVHIAECKYWNSRVPKGEVSSFVNIVSNYGANFGYVISKKGYQSGAFDVIKNTNIKLLNWIEFQELFEERWTEAMSHKLYCIATPLFNYTDIYPTRFIVNKLKTFNKKQKDRYWDLEKYFSHLPTMGLTYIKFSFPGKIDLPSKDGKKLEKILIHSKREFFDRLIELTEIANSYFDKLWSET